MANKKKGIIQRIENKDLQHLNSPNFLKLKNIGHSKEVKIS